MKRGSRKRKHGNDPGGKHPAETELTSALPSGVSNSRRHKTRTVASVKEQRQAKPASQPDRYGSSDASEAPTKLRGLSTTGTYDLRPEVKLPSDLKQPRQSIESHSIDEGAANHEEAVGKHATLSQVLDQFVRSESRLRHEHETWTDDVKTSINRCIELLNSLGDERGRSNFLKKRDDATAHLAEQKQNLETQMKVVSELSNSVGKLASRLQAGFAETRDPGDTIDAPGAQRRKKKPRTRGTILISRHSRSASRSSSLDPLEEDYYDKRGEVRKLRRDLYNQGSEVIQLTENETVSSLEAVDTDLPSVRVWDPDLRAEASADAISSLLARRQAKLEKLGEAIPELRRLWELCQSRNLDVGPLDREISFYAQYAMRASSQPPGLSHVHEMTGGGFQQEVYQIMEDTRSSLPDEFAQFTMPETRDSAVIHAWLGHIYGPSSVPAIESSTVETSSQRVSTTPIDPG